MRAPLSPNQYEHSDNDDDDPKASFTGNKTQFAKMKDANTNEENNCMKEKERKRRKKELQ